MLQTPEQYSFPADKHIQRKLSLNTAIVCGIRSGGAYKRLAPVGISSPLHILSRQVKGRQRRVAYPSIMLIAVFKEDLKVNGVWLLTVVINK